MKLKWMAALALAGTMAAAPAAAAEEPASDFKGVSYEYGEIDQEMVASSKLFRFDSGLSFEYPDAVRGVYVTGHSAGGERFGRLVNLIENSDLNAMVIDIKDDFGYLTYEPAEDSPLAGKEIGQPYIKDPRAMLEELEEKQIYPIARVVVFKDTVLAEKRPDLSYTAGGQVWKNGRKEAFVSPFMKEVWDYNVEIAIEAAKLGFKEIQFDYVRFPSDGRLDECLYSHAYGKRKPEVIEDFLRYAREQLEPLGVEVSVDLFGLVCSDPGHIGIGQNLEGVARVVGILSPMVYPSHYYPGTYGLADPDRQPYATVYRSLADAHKRLAWGDESVRGARLRPWLQAFSIKARYGREEILAQIKAARAAGVNDWLFWNAGSRYNPAHYPDEQELAALEAVPPELPREEEKPLTEGEPAGKEVLAGEPLTEEPAAGEPLTGEPLTEEPGTGEPSTGEPVTEELSTGDLLEDQAGGEETTGAPAPGEEPAGEITEEPPTGEPVTEEPLPEEPVTEELLPGEPVAGESPAGEPVTEEPFTGEPPTEEPAGEEPAGEG